MGELLIRPAGPADAADIAQVNHETWLRTYKGILDEETLKARSLEEQVRLWRDQLASNSPSEQRFLAFDNGILAGYAGGGRNPDTSSPFQAELFGIYVLQDYQRRGIGARLTSELSRWLHGRGHHSMLVWILRENPYRRFYEKLGASLLDQSRDLDYGGKRVNVVCYGWSDIQKLF